MEKSWYFVFSENILFFQKYGIEITHDSSLGNFWYQFFLTKENVEKMKDSNNFFLSFPFQIQDKIIGDLKGQTCFTATFHESFKIPHNNSNLNITFTKISNITYNIETDNLDYLLSISELHRITKRRNNVLHNRWSAGYIQKNDPPLWSSGSFQSARYLQSKGLTGNGQIVTVLDSGLDVNNPFFYDASFPIIDYNKVGLNHRKIYRYTTYGNNIDSADGHGTSVCGVICGYASICTDGTELYNGVAPESRINLIDIGHDEIESRQIYGYSILKTIDSAATANSNVITGSWGMRNNVGQSYDYDQAAKTSPNRVFIFSAGNDGSGNNGRTLSSPSDGKNILCVGALEEIYGSKLENESMRRLRLISGAKTTNIKETDIGSPFFRSKKQILNMQTGQNDFFITSNDVCQINPISAKYILFVGSAEPSACQSQISVPVFYSDDTTLTGLTDTVTVDYQIFDENGIVNYEVPQTSETSSIGPNWVGIQKPDVVAPGTNIYSAKSNTGTSCNPLTTIASVTGTSAAAPAVAGAALLVNQYFEDGYYPTGSANAANSFTPGGSLTRALIVASADPLSGATRSPNYKSGHGIVNIANVLTFDKKLKVVKNIRIASNERLVASFTVSDAAKKTRDLRIAMAYEDNPSTSTVTPLSIDLDLCLVFPDKSTIVYGNHRVNGNEEHFATIEKILLFKDEVVAGNYEIHVFGGGSISSDLTNSGKFSLCLVGPIEDNELKFESKENPKCVFPQIGMNCQMRAIELSLTDETTFTMDPQVPTYLFMNINVSYRRLSLKMARTPEMNTVVVHQFHRGSVPYYSSQYGIYISTSSANPAIGLPVGTIGSGIVGYRLQNPTETRFVCKTSFTREDGAPDRTPAQTPEATMRPVEVFGIAFGYVLTGAALIVGIVFLVLFLKLKPPQIKNRGRDISSQSVEPTNTKGKKKRKKLHQNKMKNKNRKIHNAPSSGIVNNYDDDDLDENELDDDVEIDNESESNKAKNTPEKNDRGNKDENESSSTTKNSSSSYS